MAFATMEELLNHYRDRPHDLVADIKRLVLGPPADGYDEAAVLLAARLKYQHSGSREQAQRDLERLIEYNELALCYGRFLLE